MTYQKFIQNASKQAQNAGLEPEAIKILVLELSGLNGAEFLLKLNNQLPYQDEKRFTEAIDQYLIKRLPVQHILGYSYFFGYKLKVNNQVLIPRPETEELIGHLLAFYDDIFDGHLVNVVDVGTGSGALAVTLAKEEPKMKMWATDISTEALAVAKENAKINDSEVIFLEGDMLKPLIEANLKFDIIVSNPPYIPDDEEVQDIVLDNEPHLALFGGKDGMYFYQKILSDAHQILNNPNILAFEHSFSKKEAMHEMVSKYFPQSKIVQLKDLSGKDRFTIVINQ